jgi:hypothetical protein
MKFSPNISAIAAVYYKNHKKSLSTLWGKKLGLEYYGMRYVFGNNFVSTAVGNGQVCQWGSRYKTTTLIPHKNHQ